MGIRAQYFFTQLGPEDFAAQLGLNVLEDLDTVPNENFMVQLESGWTMICLEDGDFIARAHEAINQSSKTSDLIASYCNETVNYFSLSYFKDGAEDWRFETGDIDTPYGYLETNSYRIPEAILALKQKLIEDEALDSIVDQATLALTGLSPYDVLEATEIKRIVSVSVPAPTLLGDGFSSFFFYHLGKRFFLVVAIILLIALAISVPSIGSILGLLR